MQHHYIGEDFEQAYVHAGTHGMTLMPFVDEPPETFPEYDPPLGPTSETEAWVFSVNDHLHVIIIGKHKADPRVIIQSSEFPVQLEIEDAELLE